MEYLPTNLPKYEKLTTREEVANSVVEEGHILLFSETAENLTAKLPDGTFKVLGGSGASFYQCASVDAAAGTWTGYKWEWIEEENEEGELVRKYVKSETLTTEGLTIEGFTPVAGTTYSADTKVSVGKLYSGPDTMHSDGLVFHASLASNTGTAETGQALTEVSETGATNITYQTFQGVPCAYFGGENYITFSDANLPAGISDRSISFWMRYDGESTDENSDLIFYGEQEVDNAFRCYGISMINSNLRFELKARQTAGDYITNTNAISLNTWHNVIVTHQKVSESSCTIKCYVDGVLNKELNAGIPMETTHNQGTIGKQLGNSTSYIGYMAGVRIYDRALSTEEITQLASEFTPPA